MIFCSILMQKCVKDCHGGNLFAVAAATRTVATDYTDAHG